MKELRELRKELESAIESGDGEVVDRLFNLLEKQGERCERLEKENKQLRQRIAELEIKIVPGPVRTRERQPLPIRLKRKRSGDSANNASEKRRLKNANRDGSRTRTS